MMRIDKEFFKEKKGVHNRYMYVLMCEHGKWYVGVTKIPHKRLESHFNGEGAKWTKKHRPIAVVFLEQVSIRGKKANIDATEDLLTAYFMCKYGVDNVRGGSWCHTDYDIPEEARKKAIKAIRSMTKTKVKIST